MSITDELRKYAKGYETLVNHRLLEIADRIDAEHKRAIGYVDDRDPETMEENGWVKLPVDADGVPIHIGDMLNIENNDRECEVAELTFKYGGRWFVSIDYCGGFYPDLTDCRHVQPDTWECIITDALKFAGNGGVPVGARFADYVGEFVERCERLASHGMEAES